MIVNDAEFIFFEKIVYSDPSSILKISLSFYYAVVVLYTS